MIFALALFFLSINSVRKIGFSRNLQVDWKGKITGLILCAKSWEGVPLIIII